ncbi:MAG: bifunctional 4-hydroxy-2-oxoglutarate aldolase/2-dehydro-3-deoxy-phosphogluconate aldolase [Cytophagaceae bacterium]|nr:bifunctional 4-hydroxy-2-oxoglutarate aldolase/2-dehydro-3-deoxy-phosphogluconate aldolase [Cytophagaceae bacterium]
MPVFSRIEVALKMKESGIVPLFYHDDLSLCKEVIMACYKGGAKVFEFTNRGEFALDHFKELKKYFSRECPDLALGIGTVLDPSTASVFILAGVDFIVSPILNEELVKVCNRKKVLCLPGCSTLSEISKAEELGVEIVKLFPAEQLGPAFVSAMKAPLPNTLVMPSGGVDLSEENLSAWFKAGVYCVGMGSKLITKEIIDKRDFKSLGANLKKGREIIQKIKK